MIVYYLQKAPIAISLGSLEISVRGTGLVTIKQLMEDPLKTLLLTSITINAVVYSAAAVIGSSKAGQLIHVGNSVKFSACPGEVSQNIDSIANII